MILRRLLLLLVLLAACLGGPASARSPEEQRLSAFAAELGLRDVDGFVETVLSVRRDGRLPARYVDKREAERLGWQPGDDLCRVARGRTIGGDRFGNFERRLPERQGRSWREADLDFACGRRGARRLVFSSDGLVYVTTDHYQSFREVPR